MSTIDSSIDEWPSTDDDDEEFANDANEEGTKKKKKKKKKKVADGDAGTDDDGGVKKKKKKRKSQISRSNSEDSDNASPRAGMDVPASPRTAVPPSPARPKGRLVPMSQGSEPSKPVSMRAPPLPKSDGGAARAKSMRLPPQGGRGPRGGPGRGGRSQRGFGGGRDGRGRTGRGGTPTRHSSMPLHPRGGGDPSGREGRGRGRGRAAPDRRSIGKTNSMPNKNGSFRRPPPRLMPSGGGPPDGGDMGDADPPPGAAARRKSCDGAIGFTPKPQSILRNSSHGGVKPAGILRNSSHGGVKPAGILRSSSHGSRNAARINPDGSIDDLSESNSPPSTVPMVIGGPGRGMGRDGSRRPGGRGLTLSGHYRQPSRLRVNDSDGDKSTMDHSQHSMRSKMKTSLSKNLFQSTRSVLTQDEQFVDDNAGTSFLRYIRILPPSPDEKPTKKWIRIMTWVTLVCDFTAAVVSLVTYKGITTCCGVEILRIIGNVDWNLAIDITTWVYLVMILCEVAPVVRDGLPFNLVNPFVGFLITFAMFFDDRILEAVIMWTIECSAVICEFVVYRLKLKLFTRREKRMEEVEQDLEPFREDRKRKKKLKSSRRMVSSASMSSDDEASFGGDSFHDEETNSASDDVDLSQVRELRLLRERRILRQTQTTETQHLRYHFIGVVFNVCLVGISMVLILSIATAGGLCIKDMVAPNAFQRHQLEKCNLCKGTGKEICEVCTNENKQCYYPYLFV